MKRLWLAHPGKIILAVTVLIFGLATYHDEFAPDASACKAHGGKKLYGECWVPLRTVAR